MGVEQRLPIIAAVCFWILSASGIHAEVSWVRDLVSDGNANSVPLASCLNQDGNGVLVMTAECAKGSFPRRGNVLLWEIGVDGKITRTEAENPDGGPVWTDANPVGAGCTIATDAFGNLLTVGILSAQENKKLQVGTMLKADKPQRIVLPRATIEAHTVREMKRLPDGTFALVGSRGRDGLCVRIGPQGNIILEELFDNGYSELFSDVDWVESESPGLAVVGLSTQITSGNAGASVGEILILTYDSVGKIAHKDYFTETIPGVLFPKVCSLDNGGLVVLYLKKSEAPLNRVWARSYTQELKLLWEKEVFAGDGFLFSFDVTSWRPAGFVAAVARRESLDIYFLDNQGTKVGYLQHKGTPGGAFGVAGLNLLCVNSKIVAVFQEGSAGNITECSIKARAIAVD